MPSKEFSADTDWKIVWLNIILRTLSKVNLVNAWEMLGAECQMCVCGLKQEK